MAGRDTRNLLGTLGILAAVATASMGAAPPASADEGQVRKGPALALGSGTAHAWVAMGRDGKAEMVGVSVSEAAMRDVGSLHDTALVLSLPAEAADTGIDHVLLNWNPHGHPPAEIYGSPHFDIHFYMVPSHEREAVSAADPEFRAKAARHPPAGFMPENYIPPEPDPVPGMGLHWVDANTPELHGSPFTHTLIYGSWDGKVTFVEPMVAKPIFDRRETVVAPVKQPALVAASGRYPTRYRIDFDPNAGEHRIVLEGFEARSVDLATRN